MELVLDRQRKKEISRTVIKASKGLRFLRMLGFIIVAITIVFSIIFTVIAMTSDSLYVVNVRDVPTKDYGGIVSDAILYLVIGCFLAVIDWALLSNLSGKNINEREDESLFVTDSMIRYIFRTKNHSAVSSRIVVTIPYADISSVEYFRDTRKVLLRGNFPCKYVEDYGTAKEREFDEVKFTEFIIHDYFAPSFYESIADQITIN